MKTLVLAVSLVGLAVAAGAAADAPRVSRTSIRSAEKNMDLRLSPLWPDTPLALTGRTRGVYLDGYGAVFTLEMNPASEGISLMHTSLTTQDKDHVHKLKVQRIPLLKNAVQLALVDAAASLDAVPLDEQIVIEVVLDRYEWEDPSGYPAELLFQSTRRKLLDVKRTNSGIDLAIHVTER